MNTLRDNILCSEMEKDMRKNFEKKGVGHYPDLSSSSSSSANNPGSDV